MSRVNLDDMASMQRIDPSGMGRRIAEFAWQCRQALDLVRSSDLPEEYGHADSIVILGMGGSAIGGDLVRGLLEYECRVPILINRDYRLPAFVNDRTLVIASSYSGNTEEVLNALKEALEREALCLAVTTGGE
ncbi:MAG: bifunctional phosphoglucose/phosphomannose isomerase, partial [Anaerolineae bacterium]|nr:bifunctional phosphoglucose/phosphomannose isomerase [Anaerolineae bacterium]